MYQGRCLPLVRGMSSFAAQRDTDWADEHDEHQGDRTGDGGILIPLPHTVLRSAVAPVAPVAQEVGAWLLEYLGPGFHVQLRIARHLRQARLDGWMSPAQPIKVFLTSLLRHPVVLEAQVSDTGRFEFPVAPSGACRMSFVLPTPGRAPATPPFWI